MLENFKETLKRFSEIMLFPHERKAFKISKSYDLPTSPTNEENFKENLRRFNSFLDDVERIRELLTANSISARQVQPFLSISARQISEWDKRGVLFCEREMDKGNRHYSIVDLAWIEIIYKFQSQTFSKIESTAEKLRPLIDDRLLELCLVRDYHSVIRPIAIMQEDGKARLHKRGEEFNIYEIKKLTQIIPITTIMDDTCMKVGMLAGISSVRIPISQADKEFKRVFHYDGGVLCIGDEISRIESALNLKSIIERQDKQSAGIISSACRIWE